MGLDLTVCPSRFGDREGTPESPWFLAHDRISFHRDYQIFVQVKELPSFPLPESVRFQWYGDDGLETRTEDPYGDPIRFVRSKEFAAVTPAPGTTDWNRALLIFLSSVPPETAVALWWH